jgi:hypothetical protein
MEEKENLLLEDYFSMEKKVEARLLSGSKEKEGKLSLSPAWKEKERTKSASICFYARV